MITICEMCKKNKEQCKSKNISQSWKDLINKPECLDFEQNEETKIENLKFKDK